MGVGLEGRPSQTALAAAAARAAHLVVDQEPLSFRDTAAMALLGDPGEEMVGHHRSSGDHIVLAGTRAQVTVRSRHTEQRLASSPAAAWTSTWSSAPAWTPSPPARRCWAGWGIRGPPSHHPAVEARPAGRRRHRAAGGAGVRRRRPGGRAAG